MSAKEIDAVPSEPKQATLKVKPCPGSLGQAPHLPHGSVTETMQCLIAAVSRLHAENVKLRENAP